MTSQPVIAASVVTRGSQYWLSVAPNSGRINELWVHLYPHTQGRTNYFKDRAGTVFWRANRLMQKLHEFLRLYSVCVEDMNKLIDYHIKYADAQLKEAVPETVFEHVHTSQNGGVEANCVALNDLVVDLIASFCELWEGCRFLIAETNQTKPLSNLRVYLKKYPTLVVRKDEYLAVLNKWDTRKHSSEIPVSGFAFSNRQLVVPDFTKIDGSPKVESYIDYLIDLTIDLIPGNRIVPLLPDASS